MTFSLCAPLCSALLLFAAAAATPNGPDGGAILSGARAALPSSDSFFSESDTPNSVGSDFPGRRLGGDDEQVRLVSTETAVNTLEKALKKVEEKEKPRTPEALKEDIKDIKDMCLTFLSLIQELVKNSDEEEPDWLENKNFEAAFDEVKRRKEKVKGWNPETLRFPKVHNVHAFLADRSEASPLVQMGVFTETPPLVLTEARKDALRKEYSLKPELQILAVRPVREQTPIPRSQEMSTPFGGQKGREAELRISLKAKKEPNAEVSASPILKWTKSCSEANRGSGKSSRTSASPSNKGKP